jgi:hypothetical protein
MSEAKLWIQCAKKYMFGFLWGMGWVKCKDFSSKHWDSNCQRWELCPEKIGTWWFTAIQCLMGSKPNRLPIFSSVSNLWIHVFVLDSCCQSSGLAPLPIESSEEEYAACASETQLTFPPKKVTFQKSWVDLRWKNTPTSQNIKVCYFWQSTPVNL